MYFAVLSVTVGKMGEKGGSGSSEVKSKIPSSEFLGGACGTSVIFRGNPLMIRIRRAYFLPLWTAFARREWDREGCRYFHWERYRNS